ncbi:MAG: fimbrillin family protein [Paramuribaculum sp.]|nr:fimbrillin family protein [Paramuribaculum sp.]
MKLIECFVSVAILTALTGCSSTDVIDDVKKSDTARIGFSTYMNKNSRAMDNTNFANFFVYGTYTVGTSSQPVQVFMGDRVTKGSTGAWTYTNDRYWNPQGSYDFYAYSCENAPLTVAISGHPGMNGRYLNLLDFMVTADHCTHDLVYAYALNESRQAHVDGTVSQPVSLAFKHILTRLKFTFKSEIPGDNYTVKISNVKVVNYYNSANFLGSTREWTAHARVASAGEAPELPLTLPSGGVIQKPVGGKAQRDAVSTDAVFMIPYSYLDANVSLEFDFDMQAPDSNGQLKDVMGSHITATWQPTWLKGYSVNNVITLNGSATGMDPIRFTASILPETGAAEDGWIVSGSTGNFVFDQSFN